MIKKVGESFFFLSFLLIFFPKQEIIGGFRHPPFSSPAVQFTFSYEIGPQRNGITFFSHITFQRQHILKFNNAFLGCLNNLYCGHFIGNHYRDRGGHTHRHTVAAVAGGGTTIRNYNFLINSIKHTACPHSVHVDE